MIIRFPTGLYEDVKQIPTDDTQTGNVTFIISSEDPHRTQEAFLQLPIAEEVMKRESQLFTEAERRIDQGELVYTVVSGKTVDSGSNTKLFEVGQYLEFTDDVVETVDNTNAPAVIDIMHFTNLIDLQAAGLTDAEIEQVLADAFNRQSDLEKTVTSLQVIVNNLEASITENQKLINETTKIIGALGELGTTDISLIERLNDRLSNLIIDRSSLIDQTNSNKADLEIAYNSLLRISELVR